jgi:4-amino-4-deoxy-L-arabinose transferase-like glycosyltransferase
MGKSSARSLVAGALLSFFFMLLWVNVRDLETGPYRIDEAHKISETYYLRLILEARFDDPVWFTHIVDRTNPPFGKYYMGAMILAQGRALPDHPSLAVTSGTAWYIPPQFGERESAPYRPLLVPARRASTLATAVTLAIITALLLMNGRPLGAIIAGLLFATSFLTATHGSSAVFDPLLTMLFALTLLLTLLRIETKLPPAAVDVAIGAVSALAFQTRLNGLLVLATTILVLFLSAVASHQRARVSAAIRSTAVILLTFATLALAINPYYWAHAPSDPEIPSALQANSSPLLRPIIRLQHQYADARELAGKVQQVTPGFISLQQKGRWILETGFGDIPGVLKLAGLGLLLIFWPIRSGQLAAGERLTLIWCIALCLTYLLWLPFAWPRYLLPLVPFLVILSATGWVLALRFFTENLRKQPA